MTKFYNFILEFNEYTLRKALTSLDNKYIWNKQISSRYHSELLTSLGHWKSTSNDCLLSGQGVIYLIYNHWCCSKKYHSQWLKASL
jgi:hypothetical protein